MAALPKILFEGVEDKAFLEELLEVLGLLEKFSFQKAEGVGKDGFKQILTAFVAGSAKGNVKSIIIVADNDGDPVGAFKNVQEQIGKAGFTVPQKPRETVITAELPPLSVLIIPWDNDSGCLETLCLSAANPDYKKQLDCAEGLVKCVGTGEWDIAKKSKLRMRSFLSAVCKSDPNTGLRYAWGTENGRPGNIFPLKGIATYNKIADFFKNLAA